MTFVNADERAREIEDVITGSAQIAAARDTILRSTLMVQRRETFALETTLSGAYQLRLMRDARAKGYEIDLTYLCLDNPVLNQLRVAARVALGGHNVPPADIHRRYTRSLRNLPLALALAQGARLIDNSHESAPRLIAHFEDGRSTWAAGNLPSWATAVISGVGSS